MFRTPAERVVRAHARAILRGIGFERLSLNFAPFTASSFNVDQEFRPDADALQRSHYEHAFHNSGPVQVMTRFEQARECDEVMIDVAAFVLKQEVGLYQRHSELPRQEPTKC